jgi:hypothetical protein
MRCQIVSKALTASIFRVDEHLHGLTSHETTTRFVERKNMYVFIYVYMYVCRYVCMYIPWRNSPQWAKASSLSTLRDHTQVDTHTHSRHDSSERVISPSQRPLPDNTQHSQQRDIHARAGIRTHNPSKQVAADPCVRPRGHWDMSCG